MKAPRVRLHPLPARPVRAWSYWQPDSRALVYPFPEAGRAAAAGQRHPSPDGNPGSAGSDDFAGVRSYQPGDPMRQLAWRHIARLDPALGGQLVTKQFEGGALDELVLDLDALPARLDLELKLSRLARWVLEAELRSLPYALRLGRHAIAGARPGPPGGLPGSAGPVRHRGRGPMKATALTRPLPLALPASGPSRATSRTPCCCSPAPCWCCCRTPPTCRSG
jgi:hypothetical protein